MEDVLSVVEAAYRVEQPEGAWLGGIADAARAQFPACVGGSCFTYQIDGGTRVRAQSIECRGDAPGVDAAGVASVLADHSPECVASTYGSMTCGFASESRAFRVNEYYRRRGIVDGLGINGLDPTRRGCCVVLFFGTAGRIDEPDRQRWSRAATHLAAAYRLRRRLERSNDSADAEAVLTPNGRVEHATGEARATSARTVLRDAVVRIEQARRAQGGERGDAALGDWRGLTAARWSLVEQIEHDGRRYLLARRNDVDSPGPAALSPRERQVLAFAALGRTNKVIAYDLGLAVSTVGVLVSRAMRKLEVRTRAAAIAAWNAATV